MNARSPHTETNAEDRDRSLSEMRQAVAAEVVATRAQAAVFRVEVLSGRLLASADRPHVYSFALSAVVPIADDTPGELHVGGKVYACRIVAVAGLRVFVLLAHAPAQVIERATLVAEPWAALERLQAALERHAEAPPVGATPSAALFNGDSTALEPIARVADDGQGLPLNHAQDHALTVALSRSVAAISGPPGTGKTNLLSRVAAACLAADQRVLVLAPSNDSLDALLGMLIARGGRAAYAAGALLRVGCSADPEMRQTYPLLAPEQAENRLKAQVERELSDLDAEQQALAARQQTLEVLQKAGALAQDAAGERDAVQAEVDDLQARQEAPGLQAAVNAGPRGLRARWQQVWRQALHLAGRPQRNDRNHYREDTERQRQEAYAHAQQLAEAQRRLQASTAAAERLRESLDQQLAEHELRADTIEAAYTNAAANRRTLDEKRRALQETLDKLQPATRARARLVAGTIHQALVAEEFAAGSFDVVLIDDAQRAPLAHLFWAAGLARARLVLAYEEAALQPWRCAQQAVAQRWLGRSVVTYTAGAGGQSKEWRVALSEQYGPQAPLAAAVSDWFGGTGKGGGARLLQGARSAPARGPSLSRLPVRGHTVPLAKALANESPLLLIDTGALKPWSEVVPQEGCVNVASALTAIGLAERLVEPGQPKSIALVTPYAAQARLLLHLARGRGIADAVGVFAPPSLPSGTADVVVLDTVEAPGRFAWSAVDDSRPDSQAAAFLGSVCAQARERVIVIAHWKHVRDSFGRRALLRRMLGNAVQTGGAVSAAELVASMRAGDLSSATATGADSQEVKATGSGALNGWRRLLRDVQDAKRHVTVWSPQLAQPAVERVLGALPTELLERGAVRVVTLPPGQRGGATGQADEGIQLCEQLGAIVEQRAGLTANLVTVDDRLAWECTFAPLGPGGRGAEMRCIENGQVARALRQLLSPPLPEAARWEAATFMPYTEAASLLAGSSAGLPD